MTGLPGAAVQVSAILIATLGLAWMLRRRAASLRHSVLLIGLACAALVPLLDATLPTWAHRQVTIPASLATPVVMIFASEEEAFRDTMITSAGDMPAKSGDAFGADSKPGEHTPGAAAPGGPGEGAAGRERGTLAAQGSQTKWETTWSMSTVAWRIYLAGLMLAVMSLAAGVGRLVWIVSRATAVESAAWHRQLVQITSTLRIRRPVRLVCSASVHAPATCGIARPVILLPRTARHWPRERIRAVLLHELAHVRRSDWATYLLSIVLRAVYWFNPLMWLTCARLRQEAENASDDLAVAQGCDSAGYASRLLEVARLMPGRGAAWMPAISMSRPSTLRRRVAYILDGTVSRSPATGATLAAIAALLLSVTVLVAACDAGRSNAPAASAAPNDSGATTPGKDVAAAPANPSSLEQPAPAGGTPPPAEDLSARAARQSPQPGVASTSRRPESDARQSLRQVVADVLVLVDSALDDPSLAVLDDLTYPVTGLHHVQRHARAILDDNGADPTAQAARYTEVINALRITGALAANISSRPRGRGTAGPQVERLGAALQAKSVQLRDALLPVPATAPLSSTVTSRAAAATLDIVQSALGNSALANTPQQNWLIAELETLERVARFATGETVAASSGEPGKSHLLLGSLRSSARQAFEISQRPAASGATRKGAAELAAALQELAIRVEGELRQQVRPAPLEQRIAAILTAATAGVPELALGTIRRSGELTIATYGNGGTEPLTVLIEESASEVEAMQKEELSVLTTPAAGVVREVAGQRLHTWGDDGVAGGYRVLTRIGKVVINVSAPPEMSRYVTPVTEGIARQLRQPGSIAGDPPT